MAINTNWPLMLHEWGPHWTCNGGAQPLDRYLEVTSRTRGRIAVQRGRQYELDQIRSGTLNTQWRNQDGSLDPLNTGGPWYGHIMPYQPARIRAQWPPTVNLLTQVQATGGDLGGYSPGLIPGGQQGISVFSQTDSTGGSIVASGTAWQGSNVFQFAVPASSASGLWPCWTPQVPCEPGTTYSIQMQVRNVTGSTSLPVQAFLRWVDPTGTTISTVVGSPTTLVGSSTATWTQVTATGTAPSNSAYCISGVALSSASPSSATVLQADGWQVEKAAAPSTWVAPGVTYPVWAGFTERFPSSWTMSGTYGIVSPTGVDTLSLFSQRTLRDPLTEEFYSIGPRFLYTLGDPQGAQTFTDATGAYPPAPLGISKYGAGTLTSGNQITATTSSGTFTGSTGTVVTVSNPSPGTNITAPATYISLGSAGIKGPAAPSGSWTRAIAFRYTAGTPSTVAYIWSCFGPQSGGSQFVIFITSSGQVEAFMSGPTGFAYSFPVSPSPNVADGNWHLFLFAYSHATASASVSLDGSATNYVSVDPRCEPTGLISDNLGGYVDPTVGNGTAFNYQGDLAFAAEWPTAFGATQFTPMYQAWKSACTGDSSDTRYSRILGWAGFSGPTSIQTGLTTSMGPAATDGQDVLTALQAVVDTENGAHYVDRAGVVTFRARSDRYNSLTPVWTFGENAAGGEIPYEDAATELDPTRLANQIAVTQESTNQAFSAQDSTSIADYFTRQLTRTINTTSTQECQDAANYLLSRYKQPTVRVSSIKLHPSANPALLWPVCLSLELGMRVRVMRRPPAPAPTDQIDCFVENIAWEFGDDGEAWVTLQCSPVDPTPYGLFASFHTTLANSPGAGSTTISINAGADNINPAAAQIGPGQQLILGLGTANQETVTVYSVGYATGTWTTASVALQAVTTKSHSAGDTVCEPLPAGVSAANTWDSTSQFGSIAFAY
ncbi:hypothetical protein [Kitasatospora sp. NBC_01302]|uniref:hypothetical protein n=1 Tax=Kitasatospora sp. NBC_01302 TaxID=2903575 RepID=UPI002E1214C2|nr:hypothetical protein OG294_14440 [Kitasatospora sp. NBC_01302]